MVDKIKFLSDYNDNAISVILGWAFANKKTTIDILLISGKLGIYLEQIKAEYENCNDLSTCIAAIRALAHNSLLDNPEKILRTKIDTFINNISANPKSDELWATLLAIDGILELEGKNKALQLLKIFYTKINTNWVFLLRETWERMKILGHIDEGSRFINSNPITPFHWYNKTEPVYGIYDNTII